MDGTRGERSGAQPFREPASLSTGCIESLHFSGKMRFLGNDGFLGREDADCRSMQIDAKSPQLNTGPTVFLIYRALTSTELTPARPQLRELAFFTAA